MQQYFLCLQYCILIVQLNVIWPGYCSFPSLEAQLVGTNTTRVNSKSLIFERDEPRKKPQFSPRSSWAFYSVALQSAREWLEKIQRRQKDFVLPFLWSRKHILQEEFFTAYFSIPLHTYFVQGLLAKAAGPYDERAACAVTIEGPRVGQRTVEGRPWVGRHQGLRHALHTFPNPWKFKHNSGF